MIDPDTLTEDLRAGRRTPYKYSVVDVEAGLKWETPTLESARACLVNSPDIRRTLIYAFCYVDGVDRNVLLESGGVPVVIKKRRRK